MKNNQFYKLTLTDCAIPSCCSGDKDYYGTIEEVEDLITAIKNNNSIESDVDGLQAAFTEYKSGNIECEHTVAYSKAKFLTPVRKKNGRSKTPRICGKFPAGIRIQ